MKYKITITIILFIFSLIYLNKAINFIRENDNLMIELKNKQNDYNTEPVDAIITKNTMIPGIKGKNINLKKSYQKMKKINSFQESLIVYNEILPNKSINQYYDKVIIKGNPKLQQISIIVEIDDEYLFHSINNLLKSHNIQIDLLSNKNYSLLNTNFQSITGYTYHSFIAYCLTNDLTINNLCKKSKKHTLLVYNVTSLFLNNTQTLLQNGIILLFQLNKNNYLDLNIVIKYLKNNNYNIVPINQLIKE